MFSLKNNDFNNVPCAARCQIWQRQISALYVLFHLLLRSDEKSQSSRSQRCTYFSIFESEAMKNFAAVDLSTVYAFLLLGAKNLLSLIKFLIRNPGSRAGPLRGAATNLRAADFSTVRTFPIFCSEAMKNLETEDLSTVCVFPCFGDKCEGSGSQHCMAFPLFS